MYDFDRVMNHELEDDDTPNGGVAHLGETVADFLYEEGCRADISTMEELNEALVSCGIKPIREEDVNDPEAETDLVTNEDVTGCIGQWLDMNNDQIPQEALRHLEEAYKICADQLR